MGLHGLSVEIAILKRLVGQNRRIGAFEPHCFLFYFSIKREKSGPGANDS